MLRDFPPPGPEPLCDGFLRHAQDERAPLISNEIKRRAHRLGIPGLRASVREIGMPGIEGHERAPGAGDDISLTVKRHEEIAYDLAVLVSSPPRAC